MPKGARLKPEKIVSKLRGIELVSTHSNTSGGHAKIESTKKSSQTKNSHRILINI